MVAGHEHQPAVAVGAGRRDQLREPAVERLEAPGLPLGVVAVPVLRVEVHQVREHEGRLVVPGEVVEGDVDAVVVRARVAELGQSAAVEDVPDLADPVDGDPRLERTGRGRCGPGGGTEKSRRSGVRANAPGSPRTAGR